MTILVIFRKKVKFSYPAGPLAGLVCPVGQKSVNSPVIRHFFNPAFSDAPRPPWRGKFILFVLRINNYGIFLK
jgi:hypothetical protein